MSITLAAAVALQSAALTPIDPWTVDYGNAGCVAMRRFGKPDKPVTLFFNASLGGKGLQVGIARPGGTSFHANQVQARLEIGPIVEPAQKGLQYRADKMRIDRIILPDGSGDRIGTATTLRWGREEFATGALAPLMAELDKCRADLSAHYHEAITGSDRELAVRGWRGAIADKPLVSLFSSADYPGQAMAFNEEGRMFLVLLIDDKGAQQSCTVVESTASPNLTATACYVIKTRAKFQPAQNDKGQAVRSVLKVPIVFRLSH